VGAGAVWVAGTEQTLTRIDPDAPLVAGTRPLSLPGVQNPLLGGGQPSHVTATADAVWATTTGAVWRIEPSPRRRSVLAESGCCGPVAIGIGSVWVGSRFAVDRLDLETGRPQAHIRLPFEATDIVVGESGVWLTDETSDRLWHIDPKLNAVATAIPVGQGPSGVAVGAGAVWVASADGTVSQVDPGADRVIRTINVGGTPSGIAVGEGTVWVTVD
jgi:YVTN family beta-propeller protein